MLEGGLLSSAIKLRPIFRAVEIGNFAAVLLPFLPALSVGSVGLWLAQLQTCLAERTYR